MTINMPRRNISKNALDDLIDFCKEIGWNIATIFWLWGDDKETSWAGVPVNKPKPTTPMSWANRIPLPTKEETNG